MTDEPCFLELARDFAPFPQLDVAVFDFDGTLSLIRQGWPDLMIGLFEEVLGQFPSASAVEPVRATLEADIHSLTGQPTIRQMARFVERLAEQGLEGPPAEELLSRFETRLSSRTRQRKQRLADGLVHPTEYLVPGSLEMLAHCKRRSMQLYLLSGTTRTDVVAEAQLLGLTQFFGQRVFGPDAEHPEAFSKADVLRRILAEQQRGGSQLVSFGDGPTEIRATDQLGGLSVAVASDEANPGAGRPDPGKHRRLLAAGARVVVADFRLGAELLAVCMGESER